MSAAIQIQNLVKIFGRRGKEEIRAVDGITLEVRQGTIFGLLGPNGAGKTTTIRMLTTILVPTSGTALVNGFDIVRQPLDVRKQLCVVLQEDATDDFLSVRDNLNIFGMFHGLPTAERLRRMDRVLELFGLREYVKQKPIDLSGGIKRRLQVAKVFMVDRPVVFLDEATTGMDAFNKRTTIAAIREEAAGGRTIVLTTHLLDEAEDLCTDLAIINRGTIVASGSLEMVKGMTARVHRVSFTCERIDAELLAWLERRKPLKVERSHETLDVIVDSPGDAFELIRDISTRAVVRRFEVTTPTLEDVFVELVERSRTEEPS